MTCFSWFLQVFRPGFRRALAERRCAHWWQEGHTPSRHLRCAKQSLSVAAMQEFRSREGGGGSPADSARLSISTKSRLVQRLKAAILGFVGSVRSTSSIWQNNRLDMHSRCHRRRRTAGSRNRRSSPRRRHSCGIYHAFAQEFGRFAMRHTRRATALEQSSIQTNEPCRTKTFRATRQRS